MNAAEESLRPVPAEVEFRVPAWAIFTGVCAILVVASLMHPSLAAWPSEWVVPVRTWITASLKALARDISVFGTTARDVTRFIAWLISLPLGFIEGLLYKGFRGLGIPPLPWTCVLLAVYLVAHRLSGHALALFSAACVAYLAVFGLWNDAMRTLSLVLVAVPSAAAAGLALGIAMYRHERIERLGTVAMDVMQATPHMAYLAPIAVFFGFGPVPAMIASTVFALPPMARCVMLGLRSVPETCVEAARIAGCRERQIMWKVRIPGSLPEILVGVNQVVMQTLAMTVIAALVGATGLGHRLLVALQQLQIGRALESGVAIVLIAIALDRLTRAWAKRAGEYHRQPENFFKRNAYSLTLIAIVACTVALATVSPVFQTLPRNLTVTTAPYWDVAVRWISVTFAGPLGGFRDIVTIYLLVPLRDLFSSLPWPLVLFAVGWTSWRLGGLAFAMTNVLLVGAIAISGFWAPALLTLYLTSLAVLICLAIGIPIGILAAHRPGFARWVLTVCDTLQTFPSFIYLIPVVMLFRVGDLASLIAIIGYAAVPIVRFTYLGITGVSSTVVEAAITSGATRKQRLWHVELPLALPAMLLGLNQTILMALAMTSITALIGSRDLGQEILKALPEVDTGRGILAGLSIAVIGIVANRMIAIVAGRLRSRAGLQSN